MARRRDDDRRRLCSASASASAARCSGFALKKLGKLAAFGFGSLFVLLQGLAYSGYIDVNYGKLESDVSNVLDRNHDGASPVGTCVRASARA